MRSKIVETQLQKCRVANLQNYDEATRTFYIKKYCKPQYEKGQCYLIKISNELVNNKNSVLATNWNNNRAPEYEYYKIYIHTVMGKMIKIDGVAFDFTNKIDLKDMFSGWLDIDYLEQIQTL